MYKFKKKDWLIVQDIKLHSGELFSRSRLYDLHIQVAIKILQKLSSRNKVCIIAYHDQIAI